MVYKMGQKQWYWCTAKFYIALAMLLAWTAGYVLNKRTLFNCFKMLVTVLIGTPYLDLWLTCSVEAKGQLAFFLRS